jgi:hypothetical protein
VHPKILNLRSLGFRFFTITAKPLPPWTSLLSLMAEILEDHIRLHITHPNTRTESPEELTEDLTEDLIGLVRAYLK